MKAILLAGGDARRLNPFTVSRPKPLLPIANQTILERNLQSLSAAGVNSVTIVTAQGDQGIRKTVQTGERFGLSIDYVEQEGQGIGAAVASAHKHMVHGQYFLLGYADVLSTSNMYSHILGVFNRLRAPVASVCLTDESTRHYGNVYLGENMLIEKIVEKPQQRDLGNYILGGVFVLPHEIVDIIENDDGNILDAFDRIIEKYGIHAAIWEEDWIDINYPWSILSANRLVMNTLHEKRIAADVHIPNSVTISGPVIIGAGTRICEGVAIHGPIVIGENCFIGNNALVRDYCSLGPNSEIGFGTELKNSVIFGDAIVGRISYIGDSVVGYGAHIGSGTMTINYPIQEEEVHVPVNGRLYNTHRRKLGAFIGDHALIGASNTIQAGAVIGADAVIPDHYTIERRED